MGSRQRAVGSGQWAVGSGQWAVGSRPSASAVFSDSALLPTAHCLLPTAYCPLLIEFVFTHRPQPDTINSRFEPDAALSQLIPQPAPCCIRLMASLLTAVHISLI